MDNMQLKHQINMLTPSPAPRNSEFCLLPIVQFIDAATSVERLYAEPESRSNRNQPDQDKGTWSFREGASSRSVSFQESVAQAPPETHQQTAVRSAVSEVFARVS